MKQQLGITVLFILILLVVPASTFAVEMSRGLSGPVTSATGRIGIVSDSTEVFKAPIVWIAGIFTLFYFITLKRQKPKTKTTLTYAVVGVWVLTLILMSSVANSQKQTENPYNLPTTKEWELDYAKAMLMRQGEINSAQSEVYLKDFVTDTTANPLDYLAETDYYDYNNQNVKRVSTLIKETALNFDDALQSTLDWVYTNVEYNIHEEDNACFNGKASEIITRGTGQCDTQSMVVISILRGMGIAARPVGGCVWKSSSCNFKFAMFALAGQEIRQPKFQPTTWDATKTSFSRTTEGSRFDASRMGGLHLWVEVWHPTEGWITIESTAGSIVNDYCYMYNVELYPGDSNKIEYCVSTNSEYALWCAQQG